VSDETLKEVLSSSSELAEEFDLKKAGKIKEDFQDDPENLFVAFCKELICFASLRNGIV
jgi:hypothetical protein